MIKSCMRDVKDGIYTPGVPKQADVDAAAEAAAAETPAAEAPAAEAPAEGAAAEEAPAAAADGSSVETIEEVKTEALISRLKGCVAGLYSWVAGKVLLIISPVCQLVAKIVCSITSLPWAAISLFSLSKLSTLLWGWTWFHLTSNNLALFLPVSSLLIPPTLEKVTVLPASWRPVLSQLNLLAYNLVQCLVITGGSPALEE